MLGSMNEDQNANRHMHGLESEGPQRNEGHDGNLNPRCEQPQRFQLNPDDHLAEMVRQVLHSGALDRSLKDVNKNPFISNI